MLNEISVNSLNYEPLLSFNIFLRPINASDIVRVVRGFRPCKGKEVFDKFANILKQVCRTM